MTNNQDVVKKTSNFIKKSITLKIFSVMCPHPAVAHSGRNDTESDKRKAVPAGLSGKGDQSEMGRPPDNNWPVSYRPGQDIFQRS